MLRSFALVSFCLFCTGCSFFDAPPPSGDVVDLTAQGQAENTAVEVNDLDTMDLMDVGNMVAGRNVEIFSLDQAVGAEAMSPVSKGDALGKRYNAPQIEVFPVGGTEVDPVGTPIIDDLMDEMSSNTAAAPVEEVEIEMDAAPSAEDVEMPAEPIAPIEELKMDEGVKSLLDETEADIEQGMDAPLLEDAQQIAPE